MIVEERMTTFINSMDLGNPEYLNELEKYALETFVPIIRKDMQAYLKFLMVQCQPAKILEVGTAVGFSALLMSEYAPDAHITTIENYDKRIPIARANFEKYGKSDRITLLEGDAMEILPKLSDRYDFIFMDAAKGQYINFLPDIMRLLSPGGLLVSDNVLQDGDIIESKYAVVRRDRTIHTRMRDYLYTLKHTEGLTTAILPVGDGVTVSVKR
ncbi:MAG: O-methyltransferase [Lachnospiraceae bacterium]|nr:O-methyltransferase [Candidatus Colinaster scatohippi]